MTGLTSVTFRKKAPEEVLRLAVEAGLEMIEWGGDCHVTNPREAAHMRVLCANQGIATPSFGSYFTIGRDNEDKLKHVSETACALGAKTVRVWLGTKGSRDTDPSEYQALVDQTVLAAGIAASYGVDLAFEFHRRTYNDTGTSCLKMLDSCGQGNLTTYWQPFFEGQDTENLNVVLPRIRNVHVFYWNASGRRYRLKRGTDSWSGWIQTLKSAGFSGDYILEFCRHDSARVFKKDADLLRAWINKQ